MVFLRLIETMYILQNTKNLCFHVMPVYCLRFNKNCSGLLSCVLIKHEVSNYITE